MCTYEVIVDFVGDNGHVISGGNLQDVVQVVDVEDRTARIRRIVDHNGRRLVIDLRFQVLQVDFPVAIRLEFDDNDDDHINDYDVYLQVL